MGHIEFLDAHDVCSLYPWLDGNVAAAKYDPHAGWLDSNALIMTYAKSASNGKFLTGMPGAEIIVNGNKVKGVKTANGVVATENVIIAAGAGSRQVGRTAGIEIPVVATPRESFVTPFRHQNLPKDAPFIIGADPYPYVRPEGEGAIFGWAYKRPALVEPQWPVEKMKDQRFPSVVLALLARQFHHDGRGFADTRYLRGVHHQAGYYVTRESASERAIIDAWPGIDGLFMSIAHGGHGVMTSPASGQIAAGLVLGEQLVPVFNRFSLACVSEVNDGGLL